jgi:hypothetical protein
VAASRLPQLQPHALSLSLPPRLYPPIAITPPLPLHRPNAVTASLRASLALCVVWGPMKLTGSGGCGGR